VIRVAPVLALAAVVLGIVSGEADGP